MSDIDGYEFLYFKCHMDINNAVFTLLNKYLLIFSVWSKAQWLKPLMLRWGRGLQFWDNSWLQFAQIEETSQRKTIFWTHGPHSFSLLALCLCTDRGYYCFLHGWAPQGRSYSRYKPISLATSMVCIQTGNYIKESYCPISNKKEILYFNMCPPPPTIF